MLPGRKTIILRVGAVLRCSKCRFFIAAIADRHGPAITPPLPFRAESDYIGIDIDASGLKPITFCGDSLSALQAFPDTARQEAGFQLYRVQRRLDPADWKPMTTIGRGVREIRIREGAGAYRVIYVASFAETVYVLHAFQKKTQRTAKRDLDLAAERFAM